MKYQRSEEGGRQYKLFVAEDAALEKAAKILDDLGDFLNHRPSVNLAAEIRDYRGLDYRECPKLAEVADRLVQQFPSG